MDHAGYRRGRTSAMLQALAAASALGGVKVLGLPHPRTPREITPQDTERIEAARAKRARRAEKRRK